MKTSPKLWLASTKHTEATDEELEILPRVTLATFPDCRIVSRRFLEGDTIMNVRNLAASIALCALGVTIMTTTAPAAELAVAPAHHLVGYVNTGYVFWHNVYPPPIYGPNFALSKRSRP
ncbi:MULTISPECIES: hypothetical protein [unclassified Bradyrhizobium]|uniref:hypothetical protein n=1 Tax=unclassified Bradyrhizobium TaxID=2631580 RepID=UPI001FFAE90B|nr:MULTISPECIES: hypothetical protein [unclassified Bradyrhizobium]